MRHHSRRLAERGVGRLLGRAEQHTVAAVLLDTSGELTRRHATVQQGQSMVMDWRVGVVADQLAVEARRHAEIVDIGVHQAGVVQWRQLEAKRKHVVVEVLARLGVLEAEEATEGWVEGDGEEGVLPVKLGVEAPGVCQAHDVHE